MRQMNNISLDDFVGKAISYALSHKKELKVKVVGWEGEER